MFISTSYSLLCVIGLANVSVVEDEKPTPAVRGSINFQRVKTDGSNFFIVRMVVNKEEAPKKKTRTILVPIKTEKGIEYKKQVQTYLEPVMDEKLAPLPANYSFMDINEKTVSKKEMLGKLGMGKDGKLLVMLSVDQKIPEAFKSLLRKDTIFLRPKTK